MEANKATLALCQSMFAGGREVNVNGKNLIYQSVIVGTFQAEQNKEYFGLI